MNEWDTSCGCTVHSVRMLHRMWCCAVGQALLLCPVCLFVDGALRRSTRKHSCLPTLRGGSSTVATPSTWTDLLGARAERVPDCSSYLSRIPWSAADSGLSIHPRDFRGSRGGRPLLAPSDARLHALLNASAASESTAAGSLKAASSNASAASESTTAGGLEAFSQGSAGAERFENASSKFRWNPSPPRPSTIAPVRGERPDVSHSSP